MRLLKHPAATALGATTIVLLTLLAPLASPTHMEFYHLVGPVRAVTVPVLLNFAGVWLMLTLLLAWSSRRRRAKSWVGSGLGVSLSWMMLKDWYEIHHRPMPGSVNLAFALLMFLLVIGLAIVYARARFVLYHASQVAVTVLGFVALSGLIMVAEALCYSWQARNLNAERPLHEQLAPATLPQRRGRVLWIVFDELSYRQIYEHPYKGLDLPAFNRLALTSTLFTHAVPSGILTRLVLPSLITAREYDDARTRAAGWPLDLHDRTTQKWKTLDPHQTVFQDALDTGYSTAVAGWYNPYCRILPEVLDRCFWTSRQNLPGAMYPGQSILWNSEQPVLHHFLNLAAALHLGPPVNPLATDRGFHRQDYDDLVAAGDKLLTDPSANFLLLHMPIPHPPGIYSRHTAQFVTSHATYIDNLALCDIYLAHVRQKLEENNTWDSATVVIMGDHSWRVHMGLAVAGGWTEEERVASNNVQFDDRPAYIVKMPYQRTPARVEGPFHTLHTRLLFDQVFSGHLRTPEQLAAWAQEAK